jgi:hypothetical protein
MVILTGTFFRQQEDSEQYDFTYLETAKKDSTSQCCEKHQHIIMHRKEQLVRLGMLKFNSEMSSIFSWMPDTGEDLALFDHMYEALIQIVKQKGWVDVDTHQFREFMSKASAIDLHELNLREFCDQSDILSSATMQHHSQSKFVEAAKMYIFSNNKNFFLSYV